MFILHNIQILHLCHKNLNKIYFIFEKTSQCQWFRSVLFRVHWPIHLARQINTKGKRNFSGDEVICPFINGKLVTNLIMFRSQLCIVISTCISKFVLQFVKLTDSKNFFLSIKYEYNRKIKNTPWCVENHPFEPRNRTNFLFYSPKILKITYWSKVKI